MGRYVKRLLLECGSETGLTSGVVEGWGKNAGGGRRRGHCTFTYIQSVLVGGCCVQTGCRAKGWSPDGCLSLCPGWVGIGSDGCEMVVFLRDPGPCYVQPAHTVALSQVLQEPEHQRTHKDQAEAVWVLENPEGNADHIQITFFIMKTWHAWQSQDRPCMSVVSDLWKWQSYVGTSAELSNEATCHNIPNVCKFSGNSYSYPFLCLSQHICNMLPNIKQIQQKICFPEMLHESD